MPQCEGTSKRTGEQCTAPVIRGGTLCAGHARIGVAARTPEAEALREAGNKASGVAVRNRAEERKKTLLDRIAEGLEERAGDILAAYMSAGLDKGDWRALDALVTRVYGKPVERVEQVEGERDYAQLTREERLQLIRTHLHPVRDADAA